MHGGNTTESCTPPPESAPAYFQPLYPAIDMRNKRDWPTVYHLLNKQRIDLLQGRVHFPAA